VSASNPAAPEPSEIAGRYQVVKKLGAGAFGTVYKARDTRLERMVAIKTIRLEGLAASQAGFKEMLERFEREAKTAAKLKHPGIVTIYDYDFGESHGLSFIAMEFIDGVGLDRIIADNGRLPVERAAALGAQVAEALDYAHRFEVVHRDIKPANIMVEAGDRVKVTDFGIAKPGDSAEHLTVTGSLLGTPSYMSPEQARGQKLDGRSDLFSLGCVVYEMVAGRKAFRGQQITELLFKIITEEPQPLQELEPSVPEPLVRLIQKALAKSPDARFQSGHELAEQLLALTRAGAMPTLRAVDTPTIDTPTIATAPTLAGTPTAVSPGTLPPPANPTLPSAAPPPLAPTILTPGMATAAGGHGPAAASAPPVARPAAVRPPQPVRAAKSGSGLGLVLGLAAVGVLLLVAVAGGGWWLLKQRQPTVPSIAPTPVADAGLPTAAPPPTTAPASSLPAESGPTPAAATATPTPTATVAPHTTTSATTAAAGRRVASSEPTQPAGGEAHAGPAATQPPPAGGDYGFLNEVPQQGPDGRELGEALSNAYRSGGSSGITNRRFAARPRVPRDVAPAERPAVATLLHIMFVEQAYQRQNGRYGNLHDLKTAGLLHLDVAFAAGQFERRQYRFQLTGDGSEYKVTATPLTMGPRPFIADDNGFVRVDE
jgi:serine/threonine protein kinase